MAPFQSLPFDLPTLFRAIGLLGCGIYICGFFLLSLGRLNSQGAAYFGLNLVAASCVLISLWQDFNLSSALIQMFYICVSIGAIALRLRSWRLGAGGATRAAPDPS